eukprot:5955302-Amphidinium_carterae.1
MCQVRTVLLKYSQPWVLRASSSGALELYMICTRFAPTTEMSWRCCLISQGTSVVAFDHNRRVTLSTAMLLDMGLDRLTPTHDLSATQLCALATSVGRERASRLEACPILRQAVLHAHLGVRLHGDTLSAQHEFLRHHRTRKAGSETNSPSVSGCVT